MSVCGSRSDTPGFFTSCSQALGWKPCACGAEVEAEQAAAAAASTAAVPSTEETR